jgi:hypothetical protein
VAFDTVALLRLILHFSRIQGDRLGH